MTKPQLHTPPIANLAQSPSQGVASTPSQAHAGGTPVPSETAPATSCQLGTADSSCTTCRTCKGTGILRWLTIVLLAVIWWFIPAPAQALSTKGEANLAPWVGVGTGTLQVGVNYNALHLTSHVDLTLGAQMMDLGVLLSATTGLEYVWRGEQGRLGINPYVHLGKIYDYLDYGVGIATHIQGGSPWGVRFEYRVSRNYYAFAGMGLTYRF